LPRKVRTGCESNHWHGLPQFKGVIGNDFHDFDHVPGALFEGAGDYQKGLVIIPIRFIAGMTA